MGTENLRWGKPTPQEVQMVILDWRACQLDLHSGLASLQDDVGDGWRGLYCVEGRHDARHSPGPLYIGMSVADMRKRFTAKGSLGHFLYEAEPDDGGPTTRPFADAWDLTVRWTSIEDEQSVKAIETLFIRSHKPMYNTQNTGQGDVGNFVVINVGEKGTLLPVLASQYFSKGPWPNRISTRK